MTDTSDFVFVRGPLEIVDGTFVLRIPLAVGGDKLAKLAGTMGRIEGDVLRIDIPASLVDEFAWKKGDIVAVDNGDGLLGIELWDGCDAAVSSRLAYPEVRAALSQQTAGFRSLEGPLG